MSFHDIIKALQNWGHSIIHSCKPALDYVEAHGSEAVLALAETVLTGAVAGTPWATLIAQLIPAAEAAGIKIAEDAASIILNVAKANLNAQGKPTA